MFRIRKYNFHFWKYLPNLSSKIAAKRLVKKFDSATCFDSRFAPAADKNTGIHAPTFMPKMM